MDKHNTSYNTFQGFMTTRTRDGGDWSGRASKISDTYRSTLHLGSNEQATRATQATVKNHKDQKVINTNRAVSRVKK